MGYEAIILEKKDNIATITLNRPEKLNAWNRQMHSDLADAFTSLEKDDETRVVVITGAGRAFSAGADIQQNFKDGIERTKKSPNEVVNWAYVPGGSFESLAALGKPVIAAINGYAIGIGCTLTLACDIRIASEEAKFSLPFTRLGIIPEFGSTYFLTRLVGLGKACELTFTAKVFDAAEAKEIGLVDKVVPADELNKAGYDMAASIAKLPPLAIRLAKKGLRQGINSDLASQLQYELSTLKYLRQTEDFEEATNAFLEKRTAVYKGK